MIMFSLLSMIRAWRYIRGYPTNGQSTHTNATNARKNTKLLDYRIDQLYFLFGKRRRDIYPTFVRAEYNNRLWLEMWYFEWFQANRFLRRLVKKKTKTIPFDVAALARGQVNGFRRIGHASLLGKAKRVYNRGTLGVPLMFLNNLYLNVLNRILPYRLFISDGIGRRIQKKKKKKLIVKKKKK